jgi:hypothetical protein
MTTSIAETILKHAQKLPEGTILMAKSLMHLGARAAIDQALFRLARSGRLMRAARGTYVLPVMGRFGTRPPSVQKVAQSLANATGEVLAPHGAVIANRLGLTTQVPIRSVYVTSGRPKCLKLGKQILEIQHAPHWQTNVANAPAGDAARALAWIGEGHALEALCKLKQRMPPNEWDALISLRPRLPAWMAKAVSETMVNA